MHTSRASLVAQEYKSPAMQETQEMRVRSLGQEDPLEEGMATLSSSCLGSPMARGAWWAMEHGVTKELDMT